MFSVKDDTVLDPFLGSGTTTKLAMRNGRNSIGYETDETLLPLIKKKLQAEPAASSLTITKRAS
jgi:DNA modification methylase